MPGIRAVLRHRVITLVVVLATVALTILACAVPSAAPSYQGDFPDPYVLHVGRTYYAFATGDARVHLRVMQSKDLINWTANSDPYSMTEPHRKLPEALPTLPGWAAPVYEQTWAPAVLQLEPARSSCTTRPRTTRRSGTASPSPPPPPRRARIGTVPSRRWCAVRRRHRSEPVPGHHHGEALPRCGRGNQPPPGDPAPCGANSYPPPVGPLWIAPGAHRRAAVAAQRDRRAVDDQERADALPLLRRQRLRPAHRRHRLRHLCQPTAPVPLRRPDFERALAG